MGRGKGTPIGVPLQGHASPVLGVAISRDGARIVSSGDGDRRGCGTPDRPGAGCAAGGLGPSGIQRGVQPRRHPAGLGGSDGRCACGTRPGGQLEDDLAATLAGSRGVAFSPDGPLASAGTTGPCGCGTRRPAGRRWPRCGHMPRVATASRLQPGRRPGWPRPTGTGPCALWDVASAGVVRRGGR